MKTYHGIRDLESEGDFLLATIDGKLKRYHLKEISSVLEKVSMEAGFPHSLALSAALALCVLIKSKEEAVS